MKAIDIFNFKKYFKKDGDNQLARVGHVNAVIEGLNTLEESVAPKYKIYKALISQSGTDAPTVIIAENTIGNIVWTYSGSPGVYIGTLTNGFIPGQTFGEAGVTAAPGLATFNHSGLSLTTDIITLIGMTIGGVLSNDTLFLTPIEIKVYEAVL